MTWQAKIPPNQQYIVRAIFSNEEDGINGWHFYGPFKNEQDAQEFMNSYPDDPDLIEMDAIWMNEVENTTEVEAL